MDRKYIAVLAVASALLLAGGALVRPRRKPPQQPASQPAATPQPTRRGQMRQISDFLADRVAESARHVIFVKQVAASGVVLDPATAITAPSTGAPLSIVSVTGAAEPVRLAPEGRRVEPGGWALVIGRNSSGEAISASGILGGSADVSCGGAGARKLLLNVPLDATYAGSGVFDVAGDWLGIVARCDGSWMALAQASVMTLLAGEQGASAVAWRDFGVHVREPDAEERRVLRLAGDGLFVAEVRNGSRASGAGIRPGDLLLRSGDQPLTKPEDLVSPAESIALVREGRNVKLTLDPPFALEQSLNHPILTSVHEGSRLHQAGLRAGDGILRIGRSENPPASTVQRILASAQPVFVIYERHDRRIGALVR